ncbi:hypothetical protein I7I48_02799 [Histoplasma ohiense]|nr:hypothetical protein I7I48_02799 [Histoplasma ohiense (nom. inval.)]
MRHWPDPSLPIFATKLHKTCGVHPQLQAKWETGQPAFCAVLLYAVAAGLGRPSYLGTWSSPGLCCPSGFLLSPTSSSIEELINTYMRSTGPGPCPCPCLYPPHPMSDMGTHIACNLSPVSCLLPTYIPNVSCGPTKTYPP